MAENALHSVQKLLQDLIAPDVRETKVRLEALEKRMDAEFQSMRKENEAFRNEMRAEVGAVRSEIGAVQSEMHAEIGAVRSEISAVRSEMHAEFGAVRSEIGAVRSELHAETAILRSEMTAGFQAVMHAIAELKANTESITARDVSALRERVAILEAQRNLQ